MTNHTSGPWTVISGLGIAHKPDGVIAQIKNIEAGYQTMEANARLIAAAPDLLKACKIALETLHEYANEGYPNTVKKLVESSIAKAEGREE